MKNIVLFIAVVAMLASCAPPVKLISREWKFKDVDMGPSTDSASAAFKTMARQQMLTNLLISMESDSSYTIRQLKEGRAIRGKWWFSADKKHLYFSTDLGLTEADVLKLTSKLLIYQTKDRSGQMVKMIFMPTGETGSK